MFGNNSLIAPVDDIIFTPAKRNESAPRVSPQLSQKDDCSVACTKRSVPQNVVYLYLLVQS